MINRGLIDALDDCIGRLQRGQNIDDCLRAYPQLTQVLRPLLEAGLVTRHSGPDESETGEAQARVWERLQHSRRRVIPWKPIRRTVAAAAALALIVFGVLLALSSVATHIPNRTPTVAASYTSTISVTPSTSPTVTDTLTSPTPTPTFTFTPSLVPTPSTTPTPTPIEPVTATISSVIANDTPTYIPFSQTPSATAVFTDTPRPYATSTPISTRLPYATHTPIHYPTYTRTPYPYFTYTPTPNYYRYLTYTAIANETRTKYPTRTPTPYPTYTHAGTPTMTKTP